MKNEIVALMDNLGELQVEGEKLHALAIVYHDGVLYNNDNGQDFLPETQEGIAEMFVSETERVRGAIINAYDLCQGLYSRRTGGAAI